MIVDLSELTDGFCSKLKVISFFLAVIKLKKLKKCFYIYEKKTIESPYLFKDLCLIKNFKIIKLKRKPKDAIIFNPYNYAYALKKLKKKYNIGSYYDCKFDLLSRLSYKNFIPIKKIKKKIDRLNLPKNFISIHMRTTDRALNIKDWLSGIQFPEMIFDFQINNMIKNLPNFIKSRSEIKNIFICSDDKFYKKEVLKKITNDFNIFLNNTFYTTNNLRQTNGIDFVTELFSLSKSQIIISTVGGAVPNSAALISNKSIKVYKWTNNLNYYIFFKTIVILIFYIKRLKYLFLNLINFK
jgi:hypothetical protein